MQGAQLSADTLVNYFLIDKKAVVVSQIMPSVLEVLIVPNEYSPIKILSKDRPFNRSRFCAISESAALLIFVYSFRYNQTDLTLRLNINLLRFQVKYFTQEMEVKLVHYFKISFHILRYLVLHV